MLKGSIELGRDAEVGVRHNGWARLEQADMAAEVGEDGSDLTARVGSADHRDRCGQDLEGSDVAVGEGQLVSGDGQAAGVPADGKDDVISPPTATIAGSQRVRVGKLDRAKVFDEVDPMTPQLVGQVFLLKDVAGDPVAVGQDGL